ncbi:hypothetical protein VTO73DRAFT_2808 [Trametes versicolor]
MEQTGASQEPPLCVQFPDKPRGFPVKLWRDLPARETYRSCFLRLDRPEKLPATATKPSKKVVGTVDVDIVYLAPQTIPPPHCRVLQSPHHLPPTQSPGVDHLPEHPRAVAVSPPQVNRPPLVSMSTVALAPSATPTNLNPSSSGPHQTPLRDIVLPPLLQEFYNIDDPRSTETVRFFESLYTISQPLEIPPARPHAIYPSTSSPRRDKRGTVGSSSGIAIRQNPAAEQQGTRHHPYLDKRNARRSALSRGGFARSSGEALVASSTSVHTGPSTAPLQLSAQETYARGGDTSLVQAGIDGGNVVVAPVPAHSFARTQEAGSTESFATQPRPKRSYSRAVPLPSDPPPPLATRPLHARPDHNGGPMLLRPFDQHRLGPPGVVIAPRPREHIASSVSARTSVEERKDLANGLIPIDVTSNSSAQSTAIVGIGMQLHREDHNHAIAPLSSCMHGAVRSDLALSTGSSPVTLPHAGNRNMLHPVMPARNLSAYSSLAGAMTSTAFLPTTPQAIPGAVNEFEGDHPGRTVAQCEGVPHGRTASDAFRMHDHKERDAEQHGRDVRPSPSHSIYLESASWDSGPVMAETTRLYTRAPAPVLVQQDQARSAHEHKILHPPNPQTLYARVGRSAEYSGPSYPDMAYQQIYNDIPLSNAAPHYAGSCLPSESSVTALDAPYGLSGPANMDLQYSPAAPMSVPVQFSTHQHRVASSPSAGFPSIPTQIPSSRVELDVLQAAAYDNNVLDNAREAYFKLQQQWQMLNHGAGSFAPEQPPGLDYSGADPYSQDTHTHRLSASKYAQDFGARSNPNEPQFPDMLAGQQCEYAFAGGVPSPFDRQEADGQLPYNGESPLCQWTAQALDFAQAAHYLRIALHPGTISPNVCPELLEQSPLAGDLVQEGGNDSNQRPGGYSAPECSTFVDGPSPYTFPQGPLAAAQWPGDSHLGVSVLQIKLRPTQGPYF